MWKYILKRILIAVPTLLGITVLTFSLIRMAPGDPTRLDALDEGDIHSRALSRKMVEDTRKLYGLDKPVLINLDVKDRRRSVLGAWEEIEALLEEIRLSKVLGDAANREQEQENRLRALEEELGEKSRGLREFKKRLIPYLVPLALSALEGESLEILLDALHYGAGLSAADSKGKLARWWKEQSASFKDEAILSRLTELESAAPEEAAGIAQAIREELDELMLPHLVERIETSEEGGARQVLITLAAPYAGYDLELGRKAETRRFAAALLFIGNWWKRESLAYREIGPLERLGRTFTEAQYPLWLGRILRLDFGDSYTDYRPVTEKVFEAFKVTLSFQIIVIFLIYLISVPIGVYSAVKQNSFMDRLITLVLFLLYSLPNFWVAYLLILLLCGGRFAEVFPIQGLNSAGAEGLSLLPWLMDRLWHMVLPVACMTYGGLAVLSRYARAGMLEVIRQDYIRTARAKGLPERTVILKHALRNGIIPIVTLVGGLLPALISGSVIIETIFNIPGMGRLGFMAVLERDCPVVMAIAFFTALLVLLGILLSDLLYAAVDPRIRFGEQG